MLTRWQFLIPMSLVLAVGSIGSAMEIMRSAPEATNRSKQICVHEAELKSETLAGIGQDLQHNITDSCQQDTPQASLAQFDPDDHTKTAARERVPEGPMAEPSYSVEIVVVDAKSDAYKRAAHTGFIVDDRYFCEGHLCRAVGFEVYVTPEQLSTDLPDKLVAIAFGQPRDVCDDLTPDWIRVLEQCP